MTRLVKRNKLKLGKGAAFVKSRLKRLPAVDETWEADFQALPKPIMQTETHYLGMVVTKKGGALLADTTVHGRPSVNDLATLLANAMRRPLDGDARRPKLVRLRGHHQWRELLPALEELGIEVSVERKLPGIEQAYRDSPAGTAGRAAGRDGQAVRRAGEGRGDVPGRSPGTSGATATSRSGTRRASASSSGRSATAGWTSRTTRPRRWPRRWPPWRRGWHAGSRNRARGLVEAMVASTARRTGS